MGRKFGLSKSLSTVLGAGTSICGAAAIVAVAGVIHAKGEETAVEVATVVKLGRVLMLAPVAMAGLGLDLRWAKVKAAGLEPLYATLLGTLFISVLTLGMVRLLA